MYIINKKIASNSYNQPIERLLAMQYNKIIEKEQRTDKQEETKMIYAMIEYINRNGKISVKGFSDKESAEKFAKRLEGRNVNYIMTVL